MEINFRRIRENPKIRVLTLAEIESVSGAPGDFTVTIRENPRFVSEKCTACGECELVCTIEVDDPFNYGLGKRKAAYLPFEMSYPLRYVIDPAHAGDPRMQACVDACKYGAIDLQDQPRTHTVKAGAIVYATGWQPYDARKLDNLGFGQYPDVITNVMMERLAATAGPTGGKLVKPSDGGEIKSVAFVQCAGSRDENHLPYCSAVCCLASLKQAMYVREKLPEADVHVFYIDIRAPGRYEDFYVKAQGEPKIRFHRGKVAKVGRRAGATALTVEAEDTMTGAITTADVDLVVLAVGMVPETAKMPADRASVRDAYGFLPAGADGGIVAAGCATQPLEVAATVQEATGAALQAILALGKE
jgi:quinone-modifying oxidoreductase subunit QmoA